MGNSLGTLFPYFGNKREVAQDVWLRLGSPSNYIEPFAGSLAVLLARPSAPSWEIVNDADALLANVWRSLSLAPEETEKHALYIRSEVDLHARHKALINARPAVEAMLTDPEYCDPKLAGWWIWGARLWLGGEWGLKGDKRKPAIGRSKEAFYSLEWFKDRLKNVMVLCGDWQRVLTPVYLDHVCTNYTSIFLDPPYFHHDRTGDIYAVDHDVWNDVREWALENGDNPKYRIALCGYVGEGVDMPDNWECYQYTVNGGFGNHGKESQANKNRKREAIWFSPHCPRPSLMLL